MAWYELENANDPRLDELAAEYHLHPLHLEDVHSSREERVKVDVTPTYTYALLRCPFFGAGKLSAGEHAAGLERGDEAGKEGPGELQFHTIHIFASQEFCITIADTRQPDLAAAFQRAHNAGPDANSVRILYLIFDSIVDAYFPVLDNYDDRIDELQDRVLADPSPQLLEDIFDAKSALTLLRRVLVNTRDGSMHMQRDPGTLIDNEHQLFVRDIYDHIARLLDLLETQRDLLNNTLDIYLTSIANRTNEVMKVLTVLSTIALPALVFTGIYGMNVKGLPFEDSPHGARFVAGLTVLSTVALLTWLKRLGWL